MSIKYNKNNLFRPKPIYMVYSLKPNLHKWKSKLSLNLYNQLIHKLYTDINKLYYDYSHTINKKCTIFTGRKFSNTKHTFRK